MSVVSIGYYHPSPLEPLKNQLFDDNGVSVFLKRDDLFPGEISGNKYRKLKYNLEELVQTGKKGIVTFGGIYSNHLRATAAAAKLYGIPSVGYVRDTRNGNEPENLCFLKQSGMELIFLTRDEYRQRNEPEFLLKTREKFQDYSLLPEGGTNDLAIKGCAEITKEIGSNFDWIVCPCGTGGTIAGICSSLSSGKNALGIPVLKKFDTQKRNVIGFLEEINAPVRPLFDMSYTFGGYAKTDARLKTFIRKFKADFGISLDFVYNAKTVFAVFDLITRGFFGKGSTIVIVITGGLANANILKLL